MCLITGSIQPSKLVCVFNLVGPEKRFFDKIPIPVTWYLLYFSDRKSICLNTGSATVSGSIFNTYFWVVLENGGFRFFRQDTYTDHTVFIILFRPETRMPEHRVRCRIRPSPRCRCRTTRTHRCQEIRRI